jgi:hypothetical protein
VRPLFLPSLDVSLTQQPNQSGSMNLDRARCCCYVLINLVDSKKKTKTPKKSAENRKRDVSIVSVRLDGQVHESQTVVIAGEGNLLILASDESIEWAELSQQKAA